MKLELAAIVVALVIDSSFLFVGFTWWLVPPALVAFGLVIWANYHQKRRFKQERKHD